MNSTEYAKSGNTDETPGQILIRRVKMHEFLMTGGVKVGTDERGNVVYGPPIIADPEKFPICPWHDDDKTEEANRCDAWQSILAGDGYWSKIEMELRDARNDYDVLIASPHTADVDLMEKADEIAGLEEELSLRPRDARALREQPKAPPVARGGVYAAAGPKGPGNPWDRKPTGSAGARRSSYPRITEPVDGEDISSLYGSPNLGSEGKDHWWKPKPRLEDARDTTIKAARDLGGELGDEIVIDGDEDEEEGEQGAE